MEVIIRDVQRIWKNEFRSTILRGMIVILQLRLPVKLVYSQEFSDINDAIVAERKIKGWSRKKKEALINENFDLLHVLA